jgi:hypothetical protein
LSATAAPPAPVLAPPPPTVAAPRPRPPAHPTRPSRDVTLDLLRGLAMVVLVVNHTHLDSVLNRVTEPFLSAAETLVVVSGVVVGMVFGRRWRRDGPRATSLALLRRALVLYRASVCVVALVAVLTLVPGLATDVLTVPPSGTGDLYDFEGARLLLAVVTLEAGPWQFNVLGFFIAALALAPAVLWALARGWWAPVLALSWLTYLAGRATAADVLPFQSEVAFPLLVWQLLFVHGAVAGWHRAAVARIVRRGHRFVIGAVVVIAAAVAYVRLHELGASPLGLSPEEWRAWDREHFGKAFLDPARLVSMLAFAALAYVALLHLPQRLKRAAAVPLTALGRHSFYVFIVHVFVCLAIASVPPLAGDGIGVVGNALVQAGCLALIVVMVRRRFLFRWIPR